MSPSSEMSRRQTCPECRGTGQIEGWVCARCEGKRSVPVPAESVPGSVERRKHHGVGRGGVEQSDASEPTVVKDHGGLGRRGR